MDAFRGLLARLLRRLAFLLISSAMVLLLPLPGGLKAIGGFAGRVLADIYLTTVLWDIIAARSFSIIASFIR